MKKKGLNKSYATDSPIQSKSEDGLGRWAFAERIAHTIGEREETSGLVIAIYGEWGDGKTSTLNLMERAMNKYEDIVITRFNPWYFQSTPDLIQGFFNHLAEVMGKAMKTTGGQLVDAVKKYGDMLAIFGSSITLGWGNIDFKAIKDSATSLAKEPTLAEQHKRIESLLSKSDKRIVIMVDDIDRLDKDEIQQIFKLVRLSGSFQKVTYVLAFDDQMVASALREKYSTNNGDSGLRFIEKIVQVPLHLPPADRNILRDSVFKEIDKTLDLEDIKLIERDSSAIDYEFHTSLGYALRTPRQVKRYSNAIMFAVPLLKKEVNIADLLFVEALRVFYPNIYTLMRDNPDAFLMGSSEYGGGKNKDRTAILTEVTKNIERDEQRKAVQHLIGELFPRASDRGAYGDDWERTWAEEKRVCSRAYFRRYFNYGVPKGDIADTNFSDFIGLIRDQNGNGPIKNTLKEFVKTHGAKAFLEKLILIEETLDDKVKKNIALGVALNGNLFKDNGDPFFSDLARASGYIARVHRSIEIETKRNEFASKILISSTPLPFAVETFVHLSSKDKKSEVDRSLSEDKSKELGKVISLRIAKESKKKPPYSYEHGGSRLIWHWKVFGDRKEISEYLASRLRKNPNEVSKFLASFVGTSYGSEGRRKSDLRSNDYESITELIDADVLVKIIKKSTYGKKLDTKEIHFSRTLSDDQRLINQFVSIHESQPKKVAPSEDLERAGRPPSLPI